MGTVTRLKPKPPVLVASKTDWPAVPAQLPASEYLTVSPTVQGYAVSLFGLASRIKADLSSPFVTQANAKRLQRHFAEASTLIEALSKEAAQ